MSKIGTVIVRYPAIVLMPVFTPFTFGPASWKCGAKNAGKLTLNYGLTVCNLVVSTLGILCSGYLRVSQADSDVTRTVFYLSIGTQGVAVICTYLLIMTDLVTSCPGWCKPKRTQRDVGSLLNDCPSRSDENLSEIINREQARCSIEGPKAKTIEGCGSLEPHHAIKVHD